MKAIDMSGFQSARSLLIHLTLRENRSKYKRSTLGWAWSMLNPIATMLIFTFVFLLVFKIQPPVGDPSGINNFPFFLIAGLLPWNFLAASLTGATGSIVENASLIKKVYFPRSVLPAASVLSWATNLLIELAVLAVALLLAGHVVFAFVPIVLVIVLLQGFMVTGVGMAFAALNVYFRDVTHFLSILLLMWFYATPVIYPPSLVPGSRVVGGFRIPVKAIYNLNPMVHFVDAYRAIFYDLRLPKASSFLYMGASALFFFVVGFAIFKSVEARFAEEL